jgi:hypothetical protein
MKRNFLIKNVAFTLLLCTSTLIGGTVASATTVATKSSTLSKSSISVQKEQAKKDLSYRDTLTKYVTVQADGTFSLNVPDNVKEKVPATILSKMEKGMKDTNTLIKKGELKADANTKTASSKSNNSLKASYAIEDDESYTNQEKIVRHWDGSFDLYLNSGDANRLAGKLTKGAGISGVLAVIPGIGTYLSIATVCLYGYCAGDISEANADGNGVIISYVWMDGDAYSGYVYGGASPQ